MSLMDTAQLLGNFGEFVVAAAMVATLASGDRVLAGMLCSHPGMRTVWDTVKWSYPQQD